MFECETITTPAKEIEYAVICHTKVERQSAITAVIDEVNQKLAEGWCLYAAPQLHINATSVGVWFIYLQAMVKYEDLTEKEDD